MISAELLDKLFSQICQMHMLDICAHLYIDAASYLICYTIKGLSYVATPIFMKSCLYSYMDGIKCDAIYQNTAHTCTGWALIKHRKKEHTVIRFFFYLIFV